MAWLLTLWGCGNQRTGFDVTGTVTLSGQPVPTGEVAFVPSGGPGAVGRALIKDGQLTMTDRQVTGGAYTLQIEGFDGVPYEGPEFTVARGKAIFPAVEASVDLPYADAELSVAIRETGPKQYEVDAQVQ